MSTRYSSESLYQFCLSNLNGTTNCSSVDLLLLATQKSCKTAAGQVEALLRDSYLTGRPFFQQDSWTELIPSNLVTNDTPIYNSREINSYRMNKINEITNPPRKHKTMLVYSVLMATRISLHFQLHIISLYQLHQKWVSYGH